MQHVDIGIVGGGIVGLTLAAALKESSLSVAIIDKHPLSTALGEKPAARVSAINQANIAALQTLDAWAHLQKDRANAYVAMHVWDKDSFGDIHFSCEEMGSDALGVIVENQALINALAQSVESQANVQVSRQVFQSRLKTTNIRPLLPISKPHCPMKTWQDKRSPLQGLLRCCLWQSPTFVLSCGHKHLTLLLNLPQ